MRRLNPETPIRGRSRRSWTSDSVVMRGRGRYVVTIEISHHFVHCEAEQVIPDFFQIMASSSETYYGEGV